MATVATRREKNLCIREKTKNSLDSDRPSHGRRFHKRALFLRLFWESTSAVEILPNHFSIKVRLPAVGFPFEKLTGPSFQMPTEFLRFSNVAAYLGNLVRHFLRTQN